RLNHRPMTAWSMMRRTYKPENVTFWVRGRGEGHDGRAGQRGLPVRDPNTVDRIQQTLEQAPKPAFLSPRRPPAISDDTIRGPVPMAPRVVVAEHRGVVVRLLGQAEREAAFDQPLERLGDMRRRLIIVDDPAEAVHRCEILLFRQVEPADLHLLAGEV